tara:strand:- start:54 stop:884 length:831 start_codon:yes stop_codon:yes gene_type:complete
MEKEKDIPTQETKEAVKKKKKTKPQPKKSTPKYVDKSYKLTRETAPLSLILASRHTNRFPLLHFDEETGINRPLRYARNQNSPFQDEQDDNAILEPIVFEDGFLYVPKNNQVLQQFLALHPGNGRIFVEINKAKEAAEIVSDLNTEVDALIEARQLDVEQVENVARVLFQRDVTTVTTSELRRDILIFAKKDPGGFMRLLKDPMLKLNASIQNIIDKGLLQLRNQKREVWFNTPSNKKKMCNVPYGEDPMYIIASFFQSDDGLESFKHLKSLAKNS